jgi:very-short-patch-repair endonuclease
MTAAEKWKRDRDRNHSLRKLGYTVLVIWETDWKTDKVDVLSKILEVYNEISETNFDRT